MTRADLIAAGLLRPADGEPLSRCPHYGTGLRLDERARQAFHRPHVECNLAEPERRRKRRPRRSSL